MPGCATKRSHADEACLGVAQGAVCGTASCAGTVPQSNRIRYLVMGENPVGLMEERRLEVI